MTRRLGAQWKNSGFISGHRFVALTPVQTSVAIVLLALFFSSYTFAETVPDTYKAHCSACHGINGAGDTMIGKNLKLRPLASDEVQKQSDEVLTDIISKGKGKNRMPSFERKLSKNQIADLVTYIRSLKK
jgi:cytochrome c553